MERGTRPGSDTYSDSKKKHRDESDPKHEENTVDVAYGAVVFDLRRTERTLTALIYITLLAVRSWQSSPADGGERLHQSTADGTTP